MVEVVLVVGTVMVMVSVWCSGSFLRAGGVQADYISKA